MFFKSIVSKLWLTIVSLLVISLVLAGVGLSQIVDKFYYHEITKNLTYQGEQIATLYVTTPEIYSDDVEITRISHIINAYIIILNEKGIIQTCNAGTHLSPGTVFKETELLEIFQGQTISKIEYYEHFSAKMLTVGVPIKKGGLVTQALLIYTPVEPISATLNSLRTLLISLSIGFTILASILAFFLSRTISKPLIRMNQVALSLAQGDFCQRITVKSKDEIGVLGASLNYLSAQLSEKITELSLEKEKVESILSGMSDGVISIDTKGKIILVNPQAENLLDNKLILEKDGRFTDNKDLGILISLYHEVLETEENTNGEIRIGEKTIAARLSPLFELNSDILNGLIIVLQDITKERKLEEMRREFVANVSHELRTPITLIQGYSEAMIDIADSPEQQEHFARTIFDESIRLKRLVEDLLELSRLESGANSLEKEVLDIRQVCEQLKLKLDGAFKQSNIVFEFVIGEGAESVWADRFRLEQILRNLVNNSIRYSAGGIVKLSSLKVEQGIEIRISDTGIGIAAEDLPFVFERFYRADKSRSRESGGTGLGLSIVKNLVEAHGGKITVESIPKLKTEFSMIFPQN